MSLVYQINHVLEFDSPLLSSQAAFASIKAMMNMEFPRRQESVYSPGVDRLLTSSMNVFEEWTTDPMKQKIALAMRSGAGLLASIAAIAWPEAGPLGDVVGGAGIMNVIHNIAGTLDDLKAESPNTEG